MVKFLRNCLVPLFVVLSIKTLCLVQVVCTRSPSNELLSTEKITSIKEFAELIKSTLNSKSKPCVDYYDHICTNFIDSKLALKDIQLDDGEMKDLLEKHLINLDDKIESEVKMLNFLQSCQNWEEGNKDLKEFFEKFNFPGIIEGWPILSPDWNADKFHVFDALIELKSYGFLGLFNHYFSTHADAKLLKIIPQVNYQQQDLSENELQDMRKDLLLKFGFTNVDDAVNDSINFGKTLMDALKKSPQDQSTTKINYADFKANISEINWDKYFEIARGNKIEDDTIVEIDNLDGLKVLIYVVKNMDEKIIANCFFYEIVSKIDALIKTHDTCYQQVYVHFRPVISRLIFKNFYTDEYGKYFSDITRLLVQTSKKMFTDFTNQSTESLVDEVYSVFEKQFLPSIETDVMNRFYAEVEIEADNYYKNYFQVLRINLKKKIKENFNSDEGHLVTENTISYIFTHCLYQTYKQPLGLVYQRLAGPLTGELLKSIARNLPSFNDTIRECVNRLVGVDSKLTDSQIFYIKLTLVFLKAFDDWAEENKNAVASEDEILKDFGLSNKKLLYATVMQIICEAKPKINSINLMTATFKNFNEFAVEYGCSVEDPMNPVNKCEI